MEMKEEEEDMEKRGTKGDFRDSTVGVVCCLYTPS